MKHLLFLLLFTAALFANDFVEEFLANEIRLEKKIHDENLSSDDLEEILAEQDNYFKNFAARYISEADKQSLAEQNPYRSELFRLKRRLQVNTQLNNANAVARDEIKIATLGLKQNIRTTMVQIVSATGLKTYKAFEERVQEIIVNRHQNEPKLDVEKYTYLSTITEPEPLVKSIQDNLEEYQYMQALHNNISAEIVENLQLIHKAGVISGYGLLSLTMKISSTTIAKTVDPYLSYAYVSSAKIVFILSILLFVFVVRKLITYANRRVLQVVIKTEENINYILKQSSGPFTLFTLLLTTQLVVLIYFSFSEAGWLITAFKIGYVLTVTALLYRTANAIAVVKLDQLERSEAVRNEVVNLGLKMMNGVFAVIALIIILNMLDVNLTAILSGLGIGGVAVAFAAKDTIANFFGSVSILLSDLFEQGDWIAVDDMEGHVVEIGLRATTIRTFDNALIAIPNFKLADNGIKNWSRRTMGRRIRMQIGVTYESDMKNVKKAIMEIREMLLVHPGIATEKTEYLSNERQMKLVSKEDLKGIKRTILVYLDEFASSSINILVYCFSRSVVWGEWHEVKEDVMFKIAEILKANDLEFAYPTMMIHQAKCHDNEEESV